MLHLVEKVRCKSGKDVLWAYTASLAATQAWPVEIKAKAKSINELHSLLDDFDFEDPHPTGALCTNFSDCGMDLEYTVQNAIATSRKHFDGLCLGKLSVICSRLHLLTSLRLHGNLEQK